MLDLLLKRYQPNPPQQLLSAFWQACRVCYRIDDLEQLRAWATRKRLATRTCYQLCFINQTAERDMQYGRDKYCQRTKIYSVFAIFFYGIINIKRGKLSLWEGTGHTRPELTTFAGISSVGG